MNYEQLFRVTLPETMLEVAALLALVVDLGFLRRAQLRTRAAVAALIGVVGCGAAMWTLQFRGAVDLSYNGDAVHCALLGVGGLIPAVQAGILVLTALTLVLMLESRFTRHVGEYVAVALMAASGGLLIAAARDLLVIFTGLELMSLGLYILTAFAKERGESAEAALKYYLFGGMSAAFLLFGISYLYGLTGSTNLAAIYEALSRVQGAPPPLYLAAIVFVGAGLGFKVAAVPFHFWAADAYEGAPAPAAAFIASVSKAASFGLLAAAAAAPFAHKAGADAAFVSDYPFALTLALALLSMVAGNLAALAQTSMRRLLAYSAIAHAGYMLLGVAAMLASNGNERRVGAALVYYVLTYGVTTIGAFGVVGVMERAPGSGKIDAYAGLQRRHPLLAAAMLVFLLSLAGIPPLVGFWVKFNLFAAVLGVGRGPLVFALVAVAIATSAVSLYYYLLVLKQVYVLPATDERPVKAHPAVLAAIVLMAAAVVVLGCLPALLQGWIESFL